MKLSCAVYVCVPWNTNDTPPQNGDPLGDTPPRKDPRGSYLVGLYFVFFDSLRFIRCRRNVELVAESMAKNYDWPVEKSRNLAKERDLALDRYLKGREVFQLNFDVRIPEEEIEKKLKIFLNGGEKR